MRLGMPKKILVPTDLTEVSNVALKEAVEVAKSCSAELIVLYADRFYPPLDANFELPHQFADYDDEQKRTVATNMLKERIAAIVPRDVRVQPLVVIDSPVDAILTVAKENDADWIVMGTHGRTGAARAFQGSVTEEVLRHADRPVLAIHSAA
jgi:nucleotide-binding universal stress UspA family protein